VFRELNRDEASHSPKQAPNYTHTLERPESSLMKFSGIPVRTALSQAAVFALTNVPVFAYGEVIETLSKVAVAGAVVLPLVNANPTYTL
jgi:hypothetical protein